MGSLNYITFSQFCELHEPQVQLFFLTCYCNIEIRILLILFDYSEGHRFFFLFGNFLYRAYMLCIRMLLYLFAPPLLLSTAVTDQHFVFGALSGRQYIKNKIIKGQYIKFILNFKNIKEFFEKIQTLWGQPPPQANTWSSVIKGLASCVLCLISFFVIDKKK